MGGWALIRRRMELSDARVFVKWLTCKGQLCRTGLFRIPHHKSGRSKQCHWDTIGWQGWILYTGGKRGLAL